jgi:hypothetical protein
MRKCMRGKGKMVGAKGFEPSTSWSRTNQFNPITLCLGVAYGLRSVISPLLVVPNLYLAIWSQERRAVATRGESNSAAVFLEPTSFGGKHSSSNSPDSVSGPRDKRSCACRNFWFADDSPRIYSFDSNIHLFGSMNGDQMWNSCRALLRPILRRSGSLMAL